MLRFVAIAALLSTGSAFAPVQLQSKTTSAALSRPAAQISQPAPISTELNAILENVDISEKYYPPKEKETPKVLGGVKIGLRKLVVVTGASSGLGLNCATTLAQTGRYFVVMACRDVEKAKQGRFAHNYLKLFLLLLSCYGDTECNTQSHQIVFFLLCIDSSQSPRKEAFLRTLTQL